MLSSSDKPKKPKKGDLMANILTTPGVLVLDTAAVISTTLKFKIRLIRLVPAAAAATAEIRDGADRTIAHLSAPANGLADSLVFVNPPVITGLELQSITGAGAIVEVYCI